MLDHTSPTTWLDRIFVSSLSCSCLLVSRVSDGKCTFKSMGCFGGMDFFLMIRGSYSDQAIAIQRNWMVSFCNLSLNNVPLS